MGAMYDMVEVGVAVGVVASVCFWCVLSAAVVFVISPSSDCCAAVSILSCTMESVVNGK